MYKLTAPDSQLGAGFGKVVSAVDGQILVGEPDRVLGGVPFVGRAYLFDGQTGGLRLTLNDPEPIKRSAFGTSLAGGDGSIFIGGGHLADRGRVYAFDRDTGELRYQTDGPDAGRNGFASAIAYGNGQLLVSSPSYSMPGMRAIGRAYLFDGVTGRLQHTLANPEPKSLDSFGAGVSLALSGNKAVVGALLDDLPHDDRPDGDNPGRVWLFDRSTGETLFTLENPHPQRPPPHFPPDWFGWSVAANEDTIVVGAQEDNASGIAGSGTVYVFDSNTGALKHTLLSPQLESNGEFGRSVAITPDGDVLVGAWGTSVHGIEGAGHAYLFDGETGSLLLDIPNPDPHAGIFGWSVAATERGIVVGAPGAEAVYVFEAIPEPSSLAMGILGVIALAIAVRKMKKHRPVEKGGALNTYLD